MRILFLGAFDICHDNLHSFEFYYRQYFSRCSSKDVSYRFRQYFDYLWAHVLKIEYDNFVQMKHDYNKNYKRANMSLCFIAINVFLRKASFQSSKILLNLLNLFQFKYMYMS